MLKSPACLWQCMQRSRAVMWCRFRRRAMYSTAEAIPEPHPSNVPKDYPVKVRNIVDEISKLTLIEVAELNELLKKSLNIPDTPMMAMGAMPVAAQPAEEEDEQPKAKVKTSFTVKLTKYEEAKKVPLIKEIKSIVEGMNLVQAKKFVESVPQIVRADISKDEAERLQATIKAAGGECEIE